MRVQGVWRGIAQRFKASSGISGLRVFGVSGLGCVCRREVTIRWLMSHVYGDPAILAGIRAEVDELLLKKAPPQNPALESKILDPKPPNPKP